MTYKLISFDLDGTLVDYQTHQITDKTLTVFRELTDNGYILFINTGRPLLGFPDELKEFKIYYFGACNGAKLYDLKNNVILKKDEIPYDKSAEIFDYMVKNNLFGFTFANNRRLADTKTIENGLLFYDPPRKPRKVMETFDNFSKKIIDEKIDNEKITIFFKDENKDKFFNDINQICKDLLITTSVAYNVEINNPKASKGLVLKTLCEHLNIKQDEVIAIGDNGNDISMLEYAGLSIVPENGSDDAKEVADIISDTCANSGPAKELERLLLKK